MTYGEALRILCKGIAPNPTANNECIKICKIAIDKQISKRVITNYTVEKGALARIRQCPSCGSFINNSGIEFYCFHCGQALDWSDTE